MPERLTQPPRLPQSFAKAWARHKDVVVEYHWLDGRYDELAAILNDAIRRHVAVIVTPANTPGSLAAKTATSSIPVVAKRLAVLVNPANVKTADATAQALREAAPGLGLELLFFKASTAAEIDAAFAAIVDAKADAVFIAPDGYFASRSPQLATLAARDRMPTSHFVYDAVAAGLLMSYGTSVPDVFRQVGVYTGSIIKGAKPADLPVLQSIKFEFTLNLQTARSLGIDVPPTLLARADEVIE